jgi:hypothetical protein
MEAAAWEEWPWWRIAYVCVCVPKGRVFIFQAFLSAGLSNFGEGLMYLRLFLQGFFGSFFGPEDPPAVSSLGA